MTNERTKKRDRNLVFAAMAKKDQGLPDATQRLWDSVKTGNRIGQFEFIRCSVQSFSTAKARNILTAIARDSAAGQLLMLDADMDLGDEHLLRLLSSPELMVGGVYPKKVISLQQSMVLNFTGEPVREDGLAPVTDIGAGALKIDLDLCDRMAERWPKTRYLSEDDPWRGVEMYDLWSEGVVDDVWQKGRGNWPRYLTEDFYFCWRARQLGVTIYADTLCTCGHLGQVDYLQIMALIQQLTTAPARAVSEESKGRLPEIQS